MDIKKIIIKRGIIKRENGGWGTDRPYTEGKSVLGSDGFSRMDTFLVGRKTSQPLGHTEGICSHGLLGFISQPLFSDCLGGMLVTSRKCNSCSNIHSP